MFVDGTMFWVKSGPTAHHILHPVFLKFVVLCLLQHSLLQWRPDVAQLTGWSIALLWLCIAVSIVGWFYVAGRVVKFLIYRRLMTVLYTPFLTMPLVIVNESVNQLVLWLMTGKPMPSLATILGYITRDLIVVLLYDIMFGQFVAAHHPLYIRRVRPDEMSERGAREPGRSEALPTVPAPLPTDPANAETAPEDAAPSRASKPAAEAKPPADAVRQNSDDAAPAPKPLAAPRVNTDPGGLVTIGGEVLRMQDIASIHAEDHYVRVQTTDRRYLLRARFSDVVDQLGDEQGLQITRSVWVSLSHISSVKRTADYKLFILMADGESLPVARARKQAAIRFAQSSGLPILRVG